jgi:predicted phosphodiesterase
MRILALSDIHGNVTAVARMRARQANDYDLLIVAGDIGGAKGREVFEILDTFGCPVVYVYGNHDWDVAYDIRFGTNGVHLHGTLVIIDRLCLVGFSGCPTNWGCNPIAVRLKADFSSTHAAIRRAIEESQASGSRAVERLKRSREFKAYVYARKEHYRHIIAMNTGEIAASLQSMRKPGLFVIVITHEKITRAWQYLPEANCFIYGHVHSFSDKIYRGARFLNVAALDRPISVRPRQLQRWTSRDLRLANAGNHVTFEVANNSITNVMCHRFAWDRDNWVEDREEMMVGAPYVGETPSRDT